MSATAPSASPGEQFAPRLIAWQKRHGRHDLPWQQTRDAYRIWLSEIMLQQTQVSTVIPYYARFLAEFPTLADLAQAPLERVLELWAGLGYYARARNLHACAVAVLRDHGGVFPREPERIAELPGIGRSTAAAIAAFAYGVRGAILDGNVKRVLTRCFGVEGFPGAPKVEKGLWQLAESLLPHGPGEIEIYTQGIMDLGASLCSRTKPTCAICPMAEICIARRDGRQEELPEGKPAKAVPERRSTALVVHDGERVLLERRPPSGIWGGLLALPELDVLDALGCDVVTIDGGVLVFALLVTSLTGVLFGLIPAVRGSRGDTIRSLREGGKTSSQFGIGRARGVLVVSEVALAVGVFVSPA